MPFTAAFIAHAPDAEPERDTTVLETGLYRLFTVIVRDTAQAIEVCRRLAADEALDSVILCPGNTNADVASVTAALDGKVSVSVARGDAPSAQIARAAMERAGWFGVRPGA
ncbi:MAG TPA: DUF6506 family protein [Thermoleophilia bacterium]|nr:DUF6506 family protein [Thermoleophilia bacterium]